MPYWLNQLSELVSKYIKLVDVGKGGSCNQYATHIVDNGADMRLVLEFLGHHVMQEVYNKTHPSAED